MKESLAGTASWCNGVRAANKGSLRSCRELDTAQVSSKSCASCRTRPNGSSSSAASRSPARSEYLSRARSPQLKRVTGFDRAAGLCATQRGLTPTLDAGGEEAGLCDARGIRRDGPSAQVLYRGRQQMRFLDSSGAICLAHGEHLNQTRCSSSKKRITRTRS